MGKVFEGLGAAWTRRQVGSAIPAANIPRSSLAVNDFR
jgi:hypothetical protein